MKHDPTTQRTAGQTWVRRFRRQSMLLVALSMAGSQTVQAAAADDDTARSQIVEQRGRAELHHQQRRWECSHRFMVTACMEDARAEYRAAIEALDRREAAIDSRLRHQRAQQRLAVIRQKTEALARLAPLPAHDRPFVASPLVDADAQRTQSAAAASAARGGAAGTAAERAARARVEAAQRRREEAERRRIEREQKAAAGRKQPAAGLPERPQIPPPKD